MADNKPQPCPFDRCSAVIVPVASGDATAVPGHEFAGDGLTGLCPTSFQRLPLDPRVGEYLAQTARAMDERLAVVRPTSGGSRDEHSLTPHPNGDSSWFRRTSGSSPRHNPPGEGRPVLRLVGDDEPTAGRPAGAPTQRIPLQFLPDSPAKGGSVPSVAETRGRIIEANAKIAEAMEVLRHVIGLFGEGQAVVDQIRSTTSAELGGPALMVAIDLCEQAFVRGHVAIEQNEAYGASL